MWGIIPAAGSGTRIQPLACSKELLPVGSQHDGVTEHPRAVSEYLVERMRIGGADKFCFVIGPKKFDIIEYYSSRQPSLSTVAFMIQPTPDGLCDALFRCVDLIPPDEQILIGLPDTVWFPEDGFAILPDHLFSFLLFPVATPSLFDAVIFDDERHVREIQVKQVNAASNWVWGAFKLPCRIFRELHALWCERGRKDEYVGTLVNEWLARGGTATAVPYGSLYIDVGTLPNYRKAIQLLGDEASLAGGRT